MDNDRFLISVVDAPKGTKYRRIVFGRDMLSILKIRDK